MKIRMVKTAAGPAGTYVAGKSYADVDPDLAAALIKAGSATPVRSAPIERAVADPVPTETADTPPEPVVDPEPAEPADEPKKKVATREPRTSKRTRRNAG